MIVPFDSGYPFTLNIALPVVYGSNQIYERLNEFNIENNFIAEMDQSHEYWGTVNGNWITGPNEYFYQIQDDAYSFLFNFLEDTSDNLDGDINFDDEVNILDVIQLVSVILNQGEESEICDINSDGDVDILDVILLVNIILG